MYCRSILADGRGSQSDSGYHLLRVHSDVGRKRRLLGLGRNAARMVVGLQHPEEAPTLNGFAEDSMCRKCVAWGRIIVSCPLIVRCSCRCKVV